MYIVTIYLFAINVYSLVHAYTFYIGLAILHFKHLYLLYTRLLYDISRKSYHLKNQTLPNYVHMLDTK